MTPDETRHIMLGFLEAESPPGDSESLSKYVHDDVLLPADIGQNGLQAFKALLAAYAPALQYTTVTKELIAEADKAMARRVIAGKQIGEFMGFHGRGKTFAIDEIVIAHFREGKISQLWRIADLYSMQQQLDGPSIK